jgi:hypothetical protein
MSATQTDSINYTPYQAAFLQQMLGEVGPGSTHLLLAPVGTGKSFAIAGAIAQLVEERRARRVLILSPAMLVPQWAYLLEQRGVPATAIDGRALRLLQVDGGAWPEAAYAMSIDLAKRREASASLLEVGWDLIVVDEAHGLTGQRRDVVQRLGTAPSRTSILMATHAGTEPVIEFVREGATVIDWRSAVAEFRRESAGTGPEIRRVTLPYRRTADEGALAEDVSQAARGFLAQRDPVRLRGFSLLKAASSSIAALESLLVRWVERTSIVGDEDPEGGLDVDVGEGQQEDRDVAAPTRVEVEALLEGVESLGSDSRLEAFAALLDDLVRDKVRHGVVFCEYRATLDYLAAAVERSDFADLSIHGGMTPAQRDSTVREFESGGGLLITTAAASKAFSLNFVEAAIHFDLPFNPASFAEREGRYHRYGRSLPCTAYLFEDTSGALGIENLLLKMVQKVDLVGAELGIDLDALLRAGAGGGADAQLDLISDD